MAQATGSKAKVALLLRQPATAEAPYNGVRFYAEWTTGVKPEWVVPLTAEGLPELPKQTVAELRAEAPGFVREEVATLRVSMVEEYAVKERWTSALTKPQTMLSELARVWQGPTQLWLAHAVLPRRWAYDHGLR